MSLGLVFVPCAGPCWRPSRWWPRPTGSDVLRGAHRLVCGGAAVPCSCWPSWPSGAPRASPRCVTMHHWCEGLPGSPRARRPCTRTQSDAPAADIGAGYTSASRTTSSRAPQPSTSSRPHWRAPNHFAARQAVAAAPCPTSASPQFTGITAWLHTPGGKPLSLSSSPEGRPRRLLDLLVHQLRAEPPHVEAWYRAIGPRGSS